MKKIAYASAGLLAAIMLIVAMPGTAKATDIYSLSIVGANGSLSWNGPGLDTLNAKNFTFTAITGLDVNDDPVETYSVPVGYTGTISFTTDGIYSSTDKVNGTKGTLNTTFDGGTITVKETNGINTFILASGTFDTDSLAASSVWNKVSGKYNATNSIQGTFSSATLSSILASYFDVSPDASGFIQLDSWNIKGAASVTPQSLLVGNTSGGFVTVETSPVPVPPALMLFAPGLLGLVGFRKRITK